MSNPAFGYAARLRSGHERNPALGVAGALAWWGILLGAFVWSSRLADPHEAPKQAWLLAVTLLAAGSLAAASFRGSRPRMFSWAVGGSLGLLGVSAALSWAFAPDHWLAFFGVAGSVSTSLLSWGIAALFFLTMGSLVSSGWRPRVSGLYGAFLLLVSSSFVQRLGWIDLSPGGPAARLFSPVGNALALGWIAVPVAAFALGQEWLPEESVLTRWLARAAYVAALFWLVCLDRNPLWAAWLASQAVVLAGGATRFFGARSAVGAWMGAAGLLVGILGLLLAVPSPDGLPLLASLSWRESLETVRAAWGAGGRWFGAGQGEWLQVFETVRPASLNVGSLFSIRFDVGGAFWWTLLLQQGVFGAAAWLGFLAVAAVQTFVRLRDDREALPFAVAVWTGLVSLFFFHPSVWILAALFAAAGALLSGAYASGRGFARAWVAALAVAVASLAAVAPFAVRRILADHDIRSVPADASVDAFRTAAARAETRVPWLREYALAKTQADTGWIADRLRKGVNDSTEFQRELGGAVERAKASTVRWPNDSSPWLAQGALYAAIAPVTKGADQFAIQAYQRGLALAPRQPAFALGIARVFLQRADALSAEAGGADSARTKGLAEARLEQLRLAAQWLRRALEQKPDDDSLRYTYAVVLARSGELGSALEVFRALRQARPGDVGLSLEYASLLAENGQAEEAIRLAEAVPSDSQAYFPSRRLLANWYESAQRWDEAVAALRSLPQAERQSPAMRERLRRLQSKQGTAAPVRR